MACRRREPQVWLAPSKFVSVEPAMAGSGRTLHILQARRGFSLITLQIPHLPEDPQIDEQIFADTVGSPRENAGS
jgi:hypothetical protein